MLRAYRPAVLGLRAVLALSLVSFAGPSQVVRAQSAAIQGPGGPGGGATNEGGPLGSAKSTDDLKGTPVSPDPTPTPSAGLVHIVPLGITAPPTKTAVPIPAGSQLQYWGGPVISTVHVVAVFWGPNVNPAITSVGAIDQFFTDITKSRYYDLLTEYSTTGLTGVGVPSTSSNQSINRGVFDGKFTIAPQLCAAPVAPCQVTDAQIQQELARQINGAVLPQPVSDAQGNVNSFYMIYFPPNVNIALDAVTHSCVQFCAYHSNTDLPVTPRFVPYGVQPDFAPPSGCSNGCGTGTLFDNVTLVTSHELSEAVTDALVGSANTTAPPLAWYDPDLVPGTTSQLAEIGDMCVGNAAGVVVGPKTYVVQQEFSNLQGACVSTPPNFIMVLPSDVGPGVAFNLDITVQSTVSSVPQSLPYRGTVHFSSSDPSAVLPADYTFTATDSGSHSFPVTLSTLGDQTIAFNDVRSSGFSGTTTTNVNTNPDLVVTKSHAGAFVQGQSGSYSIVASNNGRGPTSGTVTVIDTLPPGLTGSSLSGTGWTCVLATLTCTRADVLAKGNSYPAITLTVNVAVDAAFQVVNNASVSGGGETNTANDTASDPTVVNVPPRPDMATVKSHFGPIFGNFFQGETGATYNIQVSNFGNLASSGTVTVTDTLPAGLTATAITGTGWTCDLPTLSCSRSDALAASGFYPNITVTVDVALNAPSSVLNTANVSGGGEINTANDVSQDFTVILPPPAPDMGVFVGHFPFSFIQGQTGTFNITANNVGTAVTTGSVVVTDKLPAGMTATSMTGIGWACDLGTLTCTRSDALAFGTGYPTIILTVAVAADASSGTNVVSVSGGGESNLANDSFADSTTVLAPFVDLVLQITNQTQFFQGQTGATYTVAPTNTGTIPTNGTVTVTNLLPTGLTATNISGLGWDCTLATLTCTNATSEPPFGGFNGIVVIVNVAPNAPDTVTLSAAVSGGGDSVPANNNAVNVQQVSKAVTLVVAGPNSVTVSAGQPARFDLLALFQPSAGTVSFSCSGLPAGAICSFSPPNTSTTGVLVTMTVSTTARSTTLNFPEVHSVPAVPITVPVSLVIMGSLAAIVLRKRPRLRIVLGSAFLVLCFASGCGGGGGSSSAGHNPGGTPAGTFSITVTGSGSSAGTSTQVFTLIVR